MFFVEAKGILSPKNGMNVYRGCTHGCIYCDSRSVCYHIDHDFEDIEIKANAPKLLESALKSKRKKCMVGTGSMCDPYMHCEKSVKLTRQCLEIIDRYGFGVSLITKSTLVLRDIDLLKSINEKSKCVVQMTLTTYDEALCKILEPNVSTTNQRFEALKVLRDNGIPTVVWLSPLLPYINDTEENLRGILNLCFETQVKGILCFGIGTTMRDGSRDYFYSKLDESFPGMKERYIKKFGYSYECMSDNNSVLMKLFHSECAKHSVMHGVEEIFSYVHEFPDTECEQLRLF